LKIGGKPKYSMYNHHQGMIVCEWRHRFYGPKIATDSLLLHNIIPENGPGPAP